jgi:hypothetical protein
MTTLDIEILIMKHYKIRQNIIVPNVSWAFSDTKYNSLHECDVLVLSSSNYATELEIKVSKADLLKDKDKRHNHSHTLIRKLYFVVTEKLEALANIPERAGLLIATTQTRNLYNNHHKIIGEYEEPCLKEIKSPTVNKNCVKWTDTQRLKLGHLGCMRILGLKEKIQAVKLLHKQTV